MRASGKRSQTILLDIEQREFKRFPINIKVEFRILTGESASRKNPRVMLAEIDDVSEEGLFISSASIYALGTIFELKIKMPAELRPISVLGKVVWCRDDPGNCGMGLQLFKTSKNQFSEIVMNCNRGNWHQG